MSVSMRGSERVVSNGSSKKSLKGRLALAAAVSLTASGMWSACAEAARGGNDVKGARVIAGAAQIANKGNTTTIRAIDKTIIKYDRFNIPRNGTVKFIQPSSSSTVLNRIDGAMPSRIEGHFTANGIVFFVNPAGVMFGPTAVVDVGRLYAGAGTIGDQDFLGGVNKFSTSNGSVVNQGKISGDQVHLFGAQVINRGSIVADGGIVTMSSGKDVFIGEEGGNIMVKVDGPTGSKSAGVVNSGTVNANNGVVRLSGAGDIYSIAVNTSGMVKAKDVAIDAGKGAALVSGKIDASDTSAGGVGGKVTITGSKVGLVGATVDASGAAGGGTVLVGGDVHGGGSTPTATATLVSPGSTIKADAIDSGNGGKVVVWSDKLTAFGGKISAKGGANSGDGGFVEVSGKQRLIYNGTVDVTAPHGAAGTLLLDPDSITIQAANPDIADDDTNLDIANFNDLDSVAKFPGAASIITSGQLSTLLNGGNDVILQAGTSITLAAGADVTGSGTADLTLDAHTVTLNSTITLSGGGVLSGTALNVMVNSGGTIQNGLDVSGLGGTVTVNHATLTLNSPLTASGSRNLTLNIPTITLNSTITLGGGGTLSGSASSVTVNTGASIQNGVDVAASLATVVVTGSATPYVGSVVVNKKLTLEGANAGTAGFDTRTTPETTIHGQVVLKKPGTTFDGFTVEDVNFGAGVVVQDGAGDVIKNNIIRNNVFGMSLASDGSALLTVERNLFDNNNIDPLGGAHGNGIYTDFAVSHVLVDNNHFTANTEGSVSFFNTGAAPGLPAIHNLVISNNTMTDDGPISLEGISDVQITGNTINNSTAHAIWIARGVDNVTIQSNLLDNNGGAGIKFDPDGAGSITNITVHQNSITGNQDGGIVFATTVNGATITNNFIDGNGFVPPVLPAVDPTKVGSGIEFSGGTSSGVVINNNTISGNAVAGIKIGSGTYDTAVPMDAINNAWGSGNGPTAAGNSFNVTAQGDAIVKPGNVTVNYVRWLSDGTDDNAGTPGFQPGAGTLFAPITLNGNFFSNIQAAHDAASTLVVDTIGLANGEYTESVSTNREVALQFTGDGVLKGSLTLNADLTVSGDASIVIGSTVNVGSHAFVVDTQTAGGTFININGKISATGGSVQISGQQTVTINAAIDPPATVTLSSFDNVVVNAAVSATDLISITAGLGGTGGLTVNAPLGSLTSSGGLGNISISTGTTGGNVALGGSVTADSAVAISTAGTVIQTAGSLSAATLDIQGATTVNLPRETNAISGAITMTTTGVGHATLFNNTDTDLGTMTVTGNLLVTSTGTISDSGALAVTGSATFETRNDSPVSGPGNIELDQPLSTFGSITARSRNAGDSANGKGNISIVEAGTMDVTAIATNGGAINLEANKINLSGGNDSVESPLGTITLQPTSAGATIALGTDDAFGFSLTQIQIQALKDGFSGIVIGRSNGIGAITVSGNVTFTDPVSITGGSFAGAATLATNLTNNLTLHATQGKVGVVTPLNVSVGGTLAVTTDGADAAGNISVTSSTPLSVGTISTNSGGNAQSVTITGDGITLTAANPDAENDNYTFSSTAGFTVNNLTFTGNTISVTASGNITDTGSGVLKTTGSAGLTLISSGGKIGVTTGNALGVNVGGTGVLTFTTGGAGLAGNAFVTSAGTLTLGAVVTNLLDAQTVDVRTSSGNLKLNVAVTGNDNWVLNSAGNINNNGHTLSAASVDADAVTGIGTAGTFDVATAIFSADSSTSGFVNIDNVAPASATINSLSTAGGSNITYSQTGGVSATFEGAQTAANGNISLVNQGGSVIIAGPITAGGTGQAQVVSTTGTITSTGSGAVSGGTVDLQAVGGIGAVGAHLPVVANSLKATTTGLAASIFLDNTSGGTMTLTDVHTSGAGSDITVSQSGSGNRLRLGIVSATGDVTLSTAETINEAAPDTNVKITAVNVNLIADKGIGTTSQLDLAASGTVNLNTDTGDASIRNNSALTLGASSVGGSLTLTADAGITLSGQVDVGGAFTATAISGDIVANADIGGAPLLTPTSIDLHAVNISLQNVTAGAGNVTLSATGNIALNGTVNGGNAFTATAGASGNVVATQDIGGTTAPTSVTISGVDIELKNVTSGSGNQAYNASGLITLDGSDYRSSGGSISFNGPVVMTAATVDVVTTDGSAAGNDINFANTVNGTSDGGTALTLTAGAGNIAIGGDAGGNKKLKTMNATGSAISLLDVKTTELQAYSGATTLNGDYVADSGSITFTGNATLAGDTQVITSGGAEIKFTGTIKGPGGLTATAGGGGNVTIAGAGGTAAKLAFATISGGDITLAGMKTVGAQDYDAGGALALSGPYSTDNGSMSFDAGTTMALGGSYDAQGGGLTATSVGPMTLSGTSYSATDTMVFTASALSLQGDYSTTSGAITFTAPTATLTGTTNVTTTGGTDTDDISFSGTIDGVHDLTLNAHGDGDVAVVGDIGAGVGTALTLFAATGENVTVKNVTTTGDQTYTAGGTITLNGGSYSSSAGDVEFAGNTVLTTSTIVSGNQVTFGGTVNSSGAGIDLSVNGNTAINGGSVTTSGDQSYHDAVTLDDDTTLTGVNVTFDETVDSLNDTLRTLQVDASGITTFGGNVGLSHKLQSLTTTAPGSTILGTSTPITIQTQEDQVFNDAVTLGANVILEANDIKFGSTLGGPHDLTANTNTTGAPGITTFSAAVSGLNKLVTNANGETHINGGLVITTGPQGYDDAVTIGADDTTLSGSDIAFNKTLDSAVSPRALTVNSTGATTFVGNVGGNLPLLSLTTHGEAKLGTSAGGAITITTNEDQTYQDKVTLGADVTLSGNDITFSSTLDGAHALAINSNTTGVAPGTAGITTFGGEVGVLEALTSLTTNENGKTKINGGTVISATQDYKDDVELGAGLAGVTTLTGTDVTFEKKLDSDGTARSLIVTAGGVTKFNGAVGSGSALNNLTTDGPGSTQINGLSVETSGNQDYGDDVTLGQNATLDGKDFTFHKTVNSENATPRDLLINPTGGGNTTFLGVVGAAGHLLKNLKIDDDAANSGTITISAGAVTTTETQVYKDAVKLIGTNTLNGAGISFAETVNANAAAGDGSLVVNDTGTTVFTKQVGATFALGSLETDKDITAAGSTNINGGSVKTTGIQTYKDGVIVGADTTFTSTATGDITFATLNSPAVTTPTFFDVKVNTAGTTTFSGAVGATTKIKNLITDEASAAANEKGGTTRINGLTVTTSAGQTYNDAVKLGAITTLTGVTIKFSETLDSDNVSTPRALTIIDTGDTTFTKAVGGGAPLASLITDSASSNSGKTIVNGGAVTTTGNQQYNDAVTIGAGTSNLTTFTASSGSVTFANTLDSDATATARDVTVVAGSTTVAGSITFGGAVGNTGSLNNLAATAGLNSTISINGTVVKTVQDQTYNSKVSIGNSSGATLSGRNISFMSLLDGVHPLTVTGSGTTRFVGAVGSSNPLTSLKSDGGGVTQIEGGSVKTSGAQTFDDDVLVKANTAFTGVGLSFAGKIDGDSTTTRKSLSFTSGTTVTPSGNISITGTVGGLVGGTTTISTVDLTSRDMDIHSVHTAGAQTYTVTGVGKVAGTYQADNGAFLMKGNTKVGGNTTVATNGTGGGESSNDITFKGTIDGNHTLALHASGTADVVVEKAIGAGTALGGLDVDAQTIDLVSVVAKSGSGNSGDITLRVAADSPRDNRFDSDASGDADAFKPVGTIKLDGGLQSTGGDVFLGTRTPRSDVDIVAFPTILIEPPSGGTAVISGKTVTMGRNEKLVVNGSVQIKADQTAILSDITAADSIEVTAPSIKINQRVPGTVISSDGATLLHDVNTDFVAKNAINLNGSAELLDAPAGVSINPLNRVLFATAGNDVTGTPAGTSVRALLEKDFSIRLGNSPTGEFIDLRAEGASVTNPAAALAGAAPQESRQPEVENSVASSQATELQRLGIFAKPMDRDTLVGFLQGLMMYDDVPGGVASGGTVPRELYQVTRNRLSYDGARRVLDLYYIAFFKTDENGRVMLDKNGQRTDNTAIVRKTIETAIQDYREKTGQKTGSIDAKAFRQYVETTPSQTERDALKYMNRLRNLFNEILPKSDPGSRKGMGLTPFEANISRTVLIDSLGVEGIEPEKLEEAILFDTSRMSRPQMAPTLAPQAKPAK